MRAGDRKQSIRPNLELGEFLRSRRARLAPEKVGLPAGRRRRVEGLRRDELASLASISVDYYTRLEQGRHGSASPGVLDALATALRLSDAERNYLHQLAAPPGTAAVIDQVRPETVRLLHLLDPTPAALLCPAMDVLAANAGHRRLYADFESLSSRNLLHWMLSDPRARDLHGADWADNAAEMIGMLRLRSDRQLRNNARAREVIDDLTAINGFFRNMWQEGVVSTGVKRVRRFLHPEAGRIQMSVENLEVVHADGQILIVSMPEPGSPDEQLWHSVMARPAPADA